MFILDVIYIGIGNLATYRESVNDVQVGISIKITAEFQKVENKNIFDCKNIYSSFRIPLIDLILTYESIHSNLLDMNVLQTNLEESSIIGCIRNYVRYSFHVSYYT